VDRHDKPKNPKLKIVYSNILEVKMSIVIVEGCDGAGKTTLIEQAREGQKDRYFVTVRASRYPPDVKTSFQYLNWVKHQRDFDVVLDRIHFISDRIYGPLLRDQDLFHALPITFGVEGATVVYVRPPIEKIKENVLKGFQMAKVADHLDAIIRGYDEHMAILKQKGIRVIHYDYTVDDAKSFWRHVWSEIKNKGATR
jgi:hypothetical protein